MTWIVVFGVLALAGAVAVVGYAVWLAQRVGDALAEVDVVAARFRELRHMLGRVQWATLRRH